MARDTAASIRAEGDGRKAASIRRGRPVALLDANPAVDAGPNPEADPGPCVATRRPSSRQSDELHPRYRELPAFGAATGLRPEEWGALERRHVDRTRRLVRVEQENVDGSILPGGKTRNSVREAPLTRAASPRSTRSLRGSTRRLCSLHRRAGRFTSTTSVGANGRRPSRPPGSRHLRPPTTYVDTFASNALHAGVTVFELARVMGTSVRMIERHGALVDGAHAAIADRLDEVDAR